MAVRRWQLPGRSGHPLSVATPCVAPWPQPRGAFRLLADGSVRYRHAPRGDWRCGAELRAAAAKPAWVAHGCGSRVCPRCITFTERGAYRTAAQASDIWQGRVFRSHSVCTALRRRLLQASAAHAALGTPGLACPGVASAGRHGHQPCIALAGMPASAAPERSRRCPASRAAVRMHAWHSVSSNHVGAGRQQARVKSRALHRLEGLRCMRVLQLRSKHRPRAWTAAPEHESSHLLAG